MTNTPSSERSYGVLEPEHRAASDISPKVSGAALAGAVAIIGTFVAAQLGLEIPPHVEGAVAVIVAVVVGYLVPDNR